MRAGSFRLFGACASAKQLRKLGTSLGTFTTLSMPPGGTLQPKVTVTWAMALRSVRAVVPDGGPALELNASGVALEVRPGEAGDQPQHGHLEHRDGTRTPFDGLARATRDPRRGVGPRNRVHRRPHARPRRRRAVGH